MTKVLVTGGAKGVGAAIVRALVANGHDVDFTYRSSGEQAQALAAEIAEAAPGRVVRALPLDLSDKAALDAFCEQCEGETWFGLVHNAGQPYDSLAAMLVQDKAEAAMQVNFWAFTRLAKSLMRTMIRARAGRIVAIGSIAGQRALPDGLAYSTSKAGLEGLIRRVAFDLGAHGITANVVAPGAIATNIRANSEEILGDLVPDVNVGVGANPDLIDMIIPAKRRGEAREIAATVYFLASDGAAYINGDVIHVDGGWYAS